MQREPLASQLMSCMIMQRLRRRMQSGATNNLLLAYTKQTAAGACACAVRSKRNTFDCAHLLQSRPRAWASRRTASTMSPE